MFSRLLIANRGEIAVRIARTAHRLGVGTVGVYAEPDRDALHVDAVDLAVGLGGSSPAESYLRGDAIIAAAVAHGCDALHPGYGFLAENADFARQVLAAGLAWVGPTPDQIALLGDKVAAKRLAAAAGVPTTPMIELTAGAVPSDVPMPALVKAAAGGGGRGMRVVRDRSELTDALEAASREAAAAFGDGTVFVEPYVEHSRHVEVQVLGDQHGHVIHLGERECSIQRRNQKVLEESPSPGIDDTTRRALLDGAVSLARHVGYQGAGTVEFLVGADGTPTFLEVNTRLQVEHPVTEAITGFDLVELQLRVAAGEPLPIRQDDVRPDGHAIEVRIVAEDPAAGWIPTGGAIRRFSVGADVRVDAGVRSGSTVSTDYDSLLAKVIAHGATRGDAIRRLHRALRGTQLTGLRTNVDALIAVLEEPGFAAGATPTSYLDDHPQVGAATGPAGDERLALLLGAAFALEHRNRRTDPVTGFAPSGWRNLRTRGQRLRFRSDAADVVDHVEHWIDGDEARVLVGAWPEPAEDGSLPPDTRSEVHVRLLRRSEQEQVLEIDGVRHVVGTGIAGDHADPWPRTLGERTWSAPSPRTLGFGTDEVVVDAWGPAGSVTWALAPRFEDPDHVLAGGGPTSPLPGTVIAVHVAAGDRVSEGTVLVVVEAMKMEHAIAAPGPATVTEVHHGVGDRVDAGDLLVSLEPVEEP